MRLLIIILATVSTLSCGTGRDREDYGAIANGPGGISLLDASEHKGGWGRSDCTLCHNILLNVHRGTTSPVDADELLTEYLAAGSTTFCMNCHGSNGTAQ